MYLFALTKKQTKESVTALFLVDFFLFFIVVIVFVNPIIVTKL